MNGLTLPQSSAPKTSRRIKKHGLTWIIKAFFIAISIQLSIVVLLATRGYLNEKSKVTAPPRANKKKAQPKKEPHKSASQEVAEVISKVNQLTALRDVIEKSSPATITKPKPKPVIEVPDFWKGNSINATEHNTNGPSVLVISSQCEATLLGWINEYIHGFKDSIKKTVILAKCKDEATLKKRKKELSKAVVGGGTVTVIDIPMVKGEKQPMHSHSYVYWMAHHMKSVSKLKPGDIVVFMKDSNNSNTSDTSQLWQRQSLQDVSTITSSNQFACVMSPSSWSDADISRYHDTNSLLSYKPTPQSSVDMRQWLSSAELRLPFPFTDVCYGHMFAVAASRLQSRKTLWKTLVKSLSKSDVDPLMERAWGGLLAPTPDAALIKQIHSYTSGISTNEPFVGALLHHDLITDSVLPGELPDEELDTLYSGNVVGGNASHFQKIHLVISHCKEDLSWVQSDFLQGFHMYDTTIYTKCDATPEYPHPQTTIVPLPNVGRCDHTYAHAMAEIASSSSSTMSDDDLVIFRKAGREIHQSAHARSLRDMIRIASVTGFGCWLELSESLSAYHETSSLRRFKLQKYARKQERDDLENFESPFFETLGDWMDHVGGVLPDPVTQVCYGGVFAVEVGQIRKATQENGDLWRNIAKTLERGDNIQEGHFAERSWAGLLARPLSEENIENLFEYTQADVVDEDKGMNVYRGSMLRREPRVFYLQMQRLWNGDVFPGNPNKYQQIFLVVVHCDKSLRWIDSFAAGFKIAHIYIYSQCGSAPVDYPSPATLLTADKSLSHHVIYANFMHQSESHFTKENVVIFLKDDLRIDRWGRPRSLSEMLRVASVSGFGCRLRPERTRFLPESVRVSAYHDGRAIRSFRANETDGGGTAEDRFETFEDWLSSMEMKILEPVVQVCYGDIFAVEGYRISKRPAKFWKAIETSLTNKTAGDNFAERLWAAILSKHPKMNAMMQIQLYKSSQIQEGFYKGAFLKYDGEEDKWA